MKKTTLFIVSIFVFLLLITNVYATGGGLRRATIKTCPNGVTYGMHSDGHGGTHWHRAATNGDNYYAVGDAIYSDPCPGSSGNRGTAENTQGGNNNSGGSNNSYIAQPTAPPVVVKSDDATIKSITVDGTSIEVNDVMTFETEEDTISISVSTNHSKATSKINGDTEKLTSKEENKFEIVITAEAGNTKTYILNVTRKPKTSNTKLSLKINGLSATFDQDNNCETTELFSTKKVKFTYELSNETSSLKIYKDNKEIKDEDEIVLGENNYKFIITDENGDFVEYNLKIDKQGLAGSIILIIISIIFIGGFFVGVGLLIFLLVKKSNKKK